MKKNDLDKINDKMELIEKTLKDEVPIISMPIFSYEAKEERHAKEKKALIKIIVFLICAIVAIVCGFLVFANQYEVVDNGASTMVEATQSGDYNTINGGSVNYGTDSQDN